MFKWGVSNYICSKFCAISTTQQLRRFGVSTSKLGSRSFQPKRDSNSFLQQSKNRCLNRSMTKSSPTQVESGGSKLWYVVLGSSLVIGGGLYYQKFSNENKQYFKPETVSKEIKVKKPIYVEIPEEAQYLIIGAGTAAYSAARSIKALDVNAKVLIVGDEMYLPYMRPPLSKELWYTDDKESVKKLAFKSYVGKDRTVFFEKEGYFCLPKELNENEHGGIALALGLRASKIDVEGQVVNFTNGQSIKYQKCLIATGGTPKNLPIFEEAGKEVLERTLLFRTIDDFKALDELTRKVKSIVIVGGGFMGSELACALGNRAAELRTLKVTQVFPEKGNMGLVLPEYLSRWATAKIQKEGVQVLTEKQIASVKFNQKNKQVVLTLNDGTELETDHVIVSVGLDPNIDLATESGLEVDPKLGGFLVNAELEARTNLWVAGDAACFYDPRLGRRRVEHHDHAVVSGRLAGQNMTGGHKPYWHQSLLWSDLGATIGYEAIGLVDSSLQTVSVFAKAGPTVSVASDDAAAGNEDEKVEKKETSVAPTGNLPPLVEASNSLKDGFLEDFGKGVVFYIKDDVVVGVLLWNVFNKIAIARQIIKEARKFDDYSEVAKLFHLFGGPSEENEDSKDENKVAQ